MNEEEDPHENCRRQIQHVYEECRQARTVKTVLRKTAQGYEALQIVSIIWTSEGLEIVVR